MKHNMDVEHTLVILGLVFIVCNVISMLAIAWIYGRRIIETLYLPVSMKEPLMFRHQELALREPDIEHIEAQGHGLANMTSVMESVSL